MPQSSSFCYRHFRPLNILFDLCLKIAMINFPDDNRVFCRFWEDECVVYNQLTGSTHLIDGLGVEVFKSVSEKASARSELIQNLQSIFDLPIDFDLETFLDNLLLEYQKLGLLQVMENSPA